MTTPAVIRSFVDGSIDWLRRHDLLRSPDPAMPPAMRDDAVAPENDWLAWKPVPSTVTDEELDALQRAHSVKLPPLYRSLLRYVHFHELAGSVRFEPHPVDGWQREFAALYRPYRELIQRGLVPFGSETKMDAGPACFDTARVAADGDYPVVFWDHEWAGTNKEIQPLFSSTTKMFECLAFEVRAGVNFIYHDKDDDPQLLPEKRRLLTEFLAIDPAGAGGSAREYWTGWGVM